MSGYGYSGPGYNGQLGGFGGNGYQQQAQVPQQQQQQQQQSMGGYPGQQGVYGQQQGYPSAQQQQQPQPQQQSSYNGGLLNATFQPGQQRYAQPSYLQNGGYDPSQSQQPGGGFRNFSAPALSPGPGLRPPLSGGPGSSRSSAYGNEAPERPSYLGPSPTPSMMQGGYIPSPSATPLQNQRPPSAQAGLGGFSSMNRYASASPMPSSQQQQLRPASALQQNFQSQQQGPLTQDYQRYSTPTPSAASYQNQQSQAQGLSSSQGPSGPQQQQYQAPTMRTPVGGNYGVSPSLGQGVDPRVAMMQSTLLPAVGQNQLQPRQFGADAPQANLQGSFQQYNAQPLPQRQQQQQQQQFRASEAPGSSPKQIPWSLSIDEKRSYDQIFAAWDPERSGTISGGKAKDIFGQSGLPQESLMKIWTLADQDNKGALTLGEFHIAMGLIYRALNGIKVPQTLPRELQTAVSRNLGESVDFLKGLLKTDQTQRAAGGTSSTTGSGSSGAGYAKATSFHSAPTPNDLSKDGAVYKHTDDQVKESYAPSRRHLDRSSINPPSRASVTSSSTAGSSSTGLTDLRRQLENTQKMLDRMENRSSSDDAVDMEMEDLQRKVKGIQDEIERLQNGDGRMTAVERSNERRRLERELMYLMHEKLPQIEGRIEERARGKKAEDQEYSQRRDRQNDKYGRYASDDHSTPRRRSPTLDFDTNSYSQTRRAERERQDAQQRTRSPPLRSRKSPPSVSPRVKERAVPSATAPPAPPPPPVGSSNRAQMSPAPAPPAPPAPPLQSQTAEERQAYIRAEAERRIQDRLRALGVNTLSSSTSIDSAPAAANRSHASSTSIQGNNALAPSQPPQAPAPPAPPLAASVRPPATRPAAPAPPVAPRRNMGIDAQKSTAVMSAGREDTADRDRQRQLRLEEDRLARVRQEEERNARATAAVQQVKSEVEVAAIPIGASEPTPGSASATAREAAAAKLQEEEDVLRRREEVLQKERREREERLRKLEAEIAEEKIREEELQQQRQAQRATRLSPIPPTFFPDLHPMQDNQTQPLTSTNDEPPGRKSTNPFLREPTSTKMSSADPSSTNPFLRPQANLDAPGTKPLENLPLPAAQSLFGASASIVPTSGVEDDWDALEDRGDENDDDDLFSSRSGRAGLAAALFGGRPATNADRQVAGPQPNSTPQMSSAMPPPPPPPPPPALASNTSLVAPVPGAGRGALLGEIQSGRKLKKAVTNDRSTAQSAGRPLGDYSAPVRHEPVFEVRSGPTASMSRTESPVSMQPYQNGYGSVSESAYIAPARSAEESNHLPRSSLDWFGDLATENLGSRNPEAKLREQSIGPDEDSYHDAQEDVLTTSETLNAQADPLKDVNLATTYRVYTLYAYQAQRDEDLALDIDQVVIAHPNKDDSSDWWYGKTLDNRNGWFPKTYVQSLEHCVKGRVLYSYAASSDAELTISEGQTLSILDSSENDWWKAESEGLIGLVPATYIELKTEGRHLSGPHGTTDLGHLVTHAENRSEKHDLSDEDTDSSSEEDDDQVDLALKKQRERERLRVLEAAGVLTRQPSRAPSIFSGQIPARNRTSQRFIRPNIPARTLSSVSSSNASTIEISGVPYPAEPDYVDHHGIDVDYLGDSSTPVHTDDTTIIPELNQERASSIDKSLATSLSSQERHRQEALSELLRSERSYLERLQMLVQTYVEPLKRILSPRDFQCIFSNIEDLLTCDTAFFSDIELRHTKMGFHSHGIGDLIVKHAPNFRCYTRYCSKQRAASDLLIHRRKHEPAVARVLADIQQTSSTPQMDLSTYLLEPMQRLTRLPLLFKQIKKFSTDNDAVPLTEIEDLETGLAVFETILVETNEVARKEENMDRLWEIGQSLALDSIGFHLDLVNSPSAALHKERQYIMEGSLRKVKSGRKLRAYLLSDFLLLAEEEADAVTGKRAIYRTPFLISSTRVVDLTASSTSSKTMSVGRDNLSFQLLHTDGNGARITVLAETLAAKKKWLKEIQRAIDATRY